MKVSTIGQKRVDEYCPYKYRAESQAWEACRGIFLLHSLGFILRHEGGRTRIGSLSLSATMYLYPGAPSLLQGTLYGGLSTTDTTSISWVHTQRLHRPLPRRRWETGVFEGRCNTTSRSAWCNSRLPSRRLRTFLPGRKLRSRLLAPQPTWSKGRSSLPTIRELKFVSG